jgi:hypothetical protein
MAVTAPHSQLGQPVFAAATFVAGLVTLVWHNDHSGSPWRYLFYAASAALIFGGATLQFRQFAKLGAGALVAAYLIFCLFCVPGIIAAPRIYNSYGNFFEQFSLWTGAVLLYASFSAWPPATLQRIGRIFLGLCAASFALEQAFYLKATASLVPKWVPPNPMFWAIATTIFFALAALALLTKYLALLASRLLTIMIAGFGVIVWLPLLVANPHSHVNWSETAETFAIAAAFWILSGLLSQHPANGTV